VKFGAVFGVPDVLRIVFRKQLIETGLDGELSRKPQATPAVSKIFVGAAYAEHSRRDAAALAVQSGLLLFPMMFRICRPKMIRRATEL
jgi:hypothetical protein